MHVFGQAKTSIGGQMQVPAAGVRSGVLGCFMRVLVGQGVVANDLICRSTTSVFVAEVRLR
jgi:hypothetical protein